MKNKINVLILTPYFLPGYRAGGPIQSIKNLIEHLSDRINFFVVTPDHDLGAKQKYKNVRTNHWQSRNGLNVYYYGSSIKSYKKLYSTLKNFQCDIRYYNSFFHPFITIVPLILERIHWLPYKPSIVAPRGELAPAALKLKKTKKALFLHLVKLLGLYSKVHWHVTSAIEKKQVLSTFRIFSEEQIEIISNLYSKNTIVHENRLSKKKEGKLKLIFASRISRKKNLHKAISILNDVQGMVDFDIYGPKEDEGYFKECMSIAQKLPDNITVNYRGALKHQLISSVLSQYDFLFFLTSDENFGHIILESFLAGTPVIISDRTPWHNLAAKNAGWEIPLEDEHALLNVLRKCIRMNQQEHQILCKGALTIAKQYVQNKEIIEKTYSMFKKLVSKEGKR